MANKYVWSLSNFLAFLIFQVIIKKGLGSLSMLWIRLSELDLGDLRAFVFLIPGKIAVTLNKAIQPWVSVSSPPEKEVVLDDN